MDGRNDKNGSICFKIKYVKGSIATGCHVLMNCESDDPRIFDIDGYNKQYHKFWCSPKPFYGIKICSIQAYDKVKVEYESSPAVQFNITVTGHILIATQTCRFKLFPNHYYCMIIAIPSSEPDPNISLVIFVVVTSVLTIIMLLISKLNFTSIYYNNIFPALISVVIVRNINRLPVQTKV